MARKRITRRDPEEELSKFLRHEPGQGQETRKLSSQLTSLKKERRRGLLTRLGSIMAVCLLAIAFLTYYVSPLADVSTVRVLGADDLDGKSMVEVAQIKASDKVVDALRGQKKISKKLAAKYPEVASVTLSVKGLNIAREILAQSAFAPYLEKTEAFPGGDMQDEQALQNYVRSMGKTVYHPVGTCKLSTILRTPRTKMVADIMNDMFTIDGKPNQPVRKMIMGHAKKIGLINLLKDGIKGATAL